MKPKNYFAILWSFLLFPGVYLLNLFVESMIRISAIGFENFTGWGGTVYIIPPEKGIPEDFRIFVAGINLLAFCLALFVFWKKSDKETALPKRIGLFLPYLLIALTIFSYTSHYYRCNMTFGWFYNQDTCDIHPEYLLKPIFHFL